MKKTSAIFLSAALALSICLTACNKAAENTAKETGGKPLKEHQAATEESQAEETKVNAGSYRITGEGNPEITMNRQPESPYWFPKDFLDWNPQEDAALPLYQGSIPLKKRVEKEHLVPVNQTQNKDFQVAAVSILNASTSHNPPRGLNRFDVNTFSYWQYVDKLVYWGGSSGEGLIVPPSADVIDAAHTNGVPVLGTVFFPMAEHGGKTEWLEDFLLKDKNGHFPMVEQLIKTARLLNFDGWFINQETQGTKEDPLTQKHAADMMDFIYEWNTKAGEDLTLFWYDSMTRDGKLEWQNALNEENASFLIGENKEKGADSMFLNFWWSGDPENLLKSSKEYAEKSGIDPYELYAGIDVQADGVFTEVDWSSFCESNVPYTSLGLYCPSWAYFSAESLSDYENRENQLWVNQSGNPAADIELTDSQWHGVSSYAVEKTVIDSLPFLTSFSLGNGYSFFLDGKKVSSLDWNNRSLTDVAPTYRWCMEQEGNNALTPEFDYENAYYGGNSLRLSGNMENGKHSSITLYSSFLPITGETQASIYAMADQEVTAALLLKLEDGSVKKLEGDHTLSDTWSKISFDLSAVKDQTVTSIGFDFSLTGKEAPVQINLGSLSIAEEIKKNEASVKNISLSNLEFDEDGMYAGILMNWDTQGDTDFYEIYKTYEDGSKSFLGATTATAHYLHALEREQEEKTSVFEVIPVNHFLQRGSSSSVSMEWPNNSLPKSDFKASKTLAAPGEVIEFTSLASSNTTKWEWTFEGADPPSSSEKNPQVIYSEEGTYSVTLTVKNSEGAADKKIEGLIQITEKAADGLVPLSEGKTASASGYTNEEEAPKFAVDGKTETKWCAAGPAPHDITIDLGKEQLISEVSVSHAEKGKESPDLNTMWYTIEASLDNSEFEPTAEVKKNTAGETLDTFRPVKARYIKITTIKPTQGTDTAARIYEIQVYGLEDF